MNDREFFEQAAARAEKINKTCKDYELARTSLEALQQDNAVLHITVESIDKAEEKRFTLASLPRSSELTIIDHLKSLYSQRIAKCKEIVSEYVPAEKETEKPRTIMTVADSYANAIKRRAAESTPKEVTDLIASKEKFPDALVENAKKICEHEEPSTAAEEPTKAAGYVTNEEIESLLNQGLTHKQIADKTGMKPNTVSHRIAYINDKKGTERPEYKPKTYTKELTSDTELEEMYFKQGLTVKEIAEKYNVNPAGLYKRTEALKDKRFEVAKECVSSQRSKD